MIGVIDNGIDETELQNELNAKIAVDDHNICVKEELEIDRVYFHHGTICALIIEKYYPKSIINSIRILDKEGNGFVGHLEPALEWCCQNNVKIINLSLGTTNFKNRARLRRLVNKYTYRGLVIVAATANNYYRTYPACFSNVIGVAANRNVLKCNERYGQLGVDFLSSSEHQIKMSGIEFETPVSNSYAVPYISAMISRMLDDSEVLTIHEIKEKLLTENKKKIYEPDWIYKAYIIGKKILARHYIFLKRYRVLLKQQLMK